MPAKALLIAVAALAVCALAAPAIPARPSSAAVAARPSSPQPYTKRLSSKFTSQSALPDSNFTYSVYVQGVCGYRLASFAIPGQPNLQDLFVEDSWSNHNPAAYLFPGSEWLGVGHPFVVSNGDPHIVGAESDIGIAVNSKNRLYGSNGCELDRHGQSLPNRCGLYPDNGFALAVVPDGTDDLVITNTGCGVVRVSNPDNSPITVTCVTSFYGGDGMSVGASGVGYIGEAPNGSPTVLVFNAKNDGHDATGQNGWIAIIQMPDGQLSDGVLASSDGKHLLVGTQNKRLVYFDISHLQPGLTPQTPPYVYLDDGGADEDYHDWSIIGADGCIYQTQLPFYNGNCSILRITNADGSCSFVASNSANNPKTCGASCDQKARGGCSTTSVSTDASCVSIDFSTALPAGDSC